MTITHENTVRLYSKHVDVIALEMILATLRKHGAVYVEIDQFHAQPQHEEVPTLAEVLFK